MGKVSSSQQRPPTLPGGPFLASKPGERSIALSGEASSRETRLAGGNAYQAILQFHRSGRHRRIG